MTEADALRSFVVALVEAEGGRVTTNGPVLWVEASPPLADELGLGPGFALAFEADASGRFGAELVAPGSEVLERILAAATRRGRWGGSRVRAERVEPPSRAFAAAGLLGLESLEADRFEAGENRFVLFGFRVTLTSDEKEEALRLIAVDETGAAWPVDIDLGTVDAVDETPSLPASLGAGYRAAASALADVVAPDVESFRARAVERLDEEVRRILRYYDRTIEMIRESRPPGLADLVRAIEAERDRRLAEALERFDPRAAASLVFMRAVSVPSLRVRLEPSGPGPAHDVRLDAWTGRVRGARCDACGDPAGPWTWDPATGLRCGPCAPTGAASSRPRGHPRSGTPPRGSKAGRGSGRSPRGAKARPRASVAARRGR